MTDVKINFAQPANDLTELVSLNCKDVEIWRHYDKAGKPGSAAQWEELTRLERWLIGGPWLDPDLLAFHLEVLKEVEGVVLVARSGETIVGEVELLFEHSRRLKRHAHLSWIVVHPNWRRKKVGSQLIEAGRQYAREQGCDSITLVAETKVAELFYTASGFKKTSVKGHFAKKLTFDPETRRNQEIQMIPLEWKMRTRPPDGFTLVIGDNNIAQFTWAYLRRMKRLNELLEIDQPAPNLWLLRQNECEALTVDHHVVRVWLSQQNVSDTTFLKAALNVTEQLDRRKGITELRAFGFPAVYSILTDSGYKLQREEPYFESPL